MKRSAGSALFRASPTPFTGRYNDRRRVIRPKTEPAAITPNATVPGSGTSAAGVTNWLDIRAALVS